MKCCHFVTQTQVSSSNARLGFGVVFDVELLHKRAGWLFLKQRFGYWVMRPTSEYEGQKL